MEEARTEITIPGALIGNVFGKLDENIRKLEKNFSVSIVNRSDSIVLSGSDAQKASEVIRKLIKFAEKGETITDQSVNYLIESVNQDDFNEIDKINSELICMTLSGRPIKPKTLGQKKYVDCIKNNTVVFGVGPAGTGKTYLAMAMAISAFKNNSVNRIIMTRPAIEAGEKLGFLPGDLQQKVDPYLRPLYDVIYEVMGAEAYQRNQEKGLIEVIPLAYMRGRSLDNAFIVLDEAQNTTPEQMKMFLTRLGYGSKVVVTGDVTQIDLPAGKNSGLIEATKILSGIESIGIINLTSRDVVRHPLVQKIINAYDKNTAREQYKKERLNKKLLKRKK